MLCNTRNEILLYEKTVPYLFAHPIDLHLKYFLIKYNK